MSVGLRNDSRRARQNRACPPLYYRGGTARKLARSKQLSEEMRPQNATIAASTPQNDRCIQCSTEQTARRGQGHITKFRPTNPRPHRSTPIYQSARLCNHRTKDPPEHHKIDTPRPQPRTSGRIGTPTPARPPPPASLAGSRRLPAGVDLEEMKQALGARLKKRLF